MLNSKISIHLSQTQLFQWRDVEGVTWTIENIYTQLFQWRDVEGVTWTIENILLLKLAFRGVIHSLTNQKGLDISKFKHLSLVIFIAQIHIEIKLQDS